MKINYIILAHKNPQQVQRLVQKLHEPFTNFYIHIDQNVDLFPFEKLLKNLDRVFFLQDEQRKKGTWGDIEIVKGILTAVRKVVEDNNSGYSILLTGQDYPIRDNQEIKKILKKNKGTIYLSPFSIPDERWENGGLPRLNYYKVVKSEKGRNILLLPSIFCREFYTKKTFGNLYHLWKTGKLKEIFKVFKKRKHPKILKPYGGSAYWALPFDFLKEVLDFCDKNPEFLKFHVDTVCVDEIFFNSIIMHLNQKHQRRMEPSLTYANWIRPNSPKPAIMGSGDLSELFMASKKHFFARKFDITLNKQILDEIDKSLIS